MTLLLRVALLVVATSFGPIARAGSPVDTLIPPARLAPARGAMGVHPAVVRVIAPGRGSISYGSGTLVAVGDRYGLVVTNWHVVNDATDQISVLFPDGFHSVGVVRKIDRDWDLAAIVIWKPNVAPVPVAGHAPRPGEPLTIAGYGSGSYRAVSGACTQYVAPGRNFPFEMVELAAAARQGDSGGPILNARGELAGVLFGAGGGRTSGSYCGRVRWFLDSITPEPQSAGTMLAQRPASRPSAPSASPPAPFSHQIAGSQRPTGSNWHPAGVQQTHGERHFAAPPVTSMPGQPAVVVTAPTSTLSASSSARAPTKSQYLSWNDIAGTSLAEQAKTLLAAIGGAGLLVVALKSLSR